MGSERRNEINNTTNISNLPRFHEPEQTTLEAKRDVANALENLHPILFGDEGPERTVGPSWSQFWLAV